MPKFTRRAEDWAPVPETALIIVAGSSQKYHLTTCEYGSSVYLPRASFYLTSGHAEEDGYRSCRVCYAGHFQPNLIAEVPIHDVLAAYENVIASSLEEQTTSFDDEEEAAGTIQFNLEKIEALLGRIRSNADIVDPEEKWPFGRLVGATVRLRWPDGSLDQFRLVAGEEEFGNGRDRISIASPLGKAITKAEVGDSLPFEAPGGDQLVTVLSISLADDWGQQELDA